MPLMNFLEKSGTKQYLSTALLEADLDKEWAFRFPVIEGVATQEEVDKATLMELQFLNGLASHKQEYFADAIAYSLAKVMYPDNI